MQLNASVYYYDYENISLQFYEFGLAGPGTSVSTRLPPGRTAPRLTYCGC